MPHDVVLNPLIIIVIQVQLQVNRLVVVITLCCPRILYMYLMIVM